jgi:hypothetical protein
MPDVVEQSDGARDEEGDDEVEEVDEVIVGVLIEFVRVAPEISYLLLTINIKVYLHMSQAIEEISHFRK